MHQQNPHSHTGSQNADGRLILRTGLTLLLAGWRESGGSARRRKASSAVLLVSSQAALDVHARVI